MKSDMKHVMLIGAMKSGTSTLYKLLIQHPEIAEGVKKETEYFSRSVGNPTLKEGEYLDKFLVDPSVHKFTLDASTGYTKYPAEKGVPKRIKEYGIDPYFIYIIRNPFDRIKSHYNFLKKGFSEKKQIDSKYFIELSSYYKQLEQYTSIFPKERVLLLDFDDLKNDPANLCKTVFEFIGAKEFNIDLNNNIIANKTKPTSRNHFLVKKRLKSYSKYSPVFLNKLVKNIIELIFPTKEKKLSKKQKLKIREALREDMEKLKSEYNFPVEKWLTDIKE